MGRTEIIDLTKSEREERKQIAWDFTDRIAKLARSICERRGTWPDEFPMLSEWLHCKLFAAAFSAHLTAVAKASD